MVADRAAIALSACRPEPLASYLQALGVLRLVAEQADSDATLHWADGCAQLGCALDEEGLLTFLLERYSPTPVIAPWNGGSGFYPGDNTKPVERLTGSDDPRFGPFVAALAQARAIVQAAGLEAKPGTEAKAGLLAALRSGLPDDAVQWLDAAVVLTGDGPKYPPLLGTGGNDGRLEFTNNFMQRLVEVLLEDRDRSRQWLEASLLDRPTSGLVKAAIGQFAPGSAGGANAGQGFEADSATNPWTYVLMLEGALLFAAATSRRLESAGPGVLAYPFAVRPVVAGPGSGAAGEEETGRQELWLPLWARPVGLAELRALLGEGRARVGRRVARDGVDFVRAIAGLGVARGIDGFQRFGFHLRNGRAYFAAPLGRIPVRRRPVGDLIAPLDPWLDRLRQSSRSPHAPASLARLRRRLDDALFELCRRGSALEHQETLIVLGELEALFVRSPRMREELRLEPVPTLQDAWLRGADDGSVELRLAAALSSAGLRRRLGPIAAGPRRAKWLTGAEDDRAAVFGRGTVTAGLLRWGARVEFEQDRSEGSESAGEGRDHMVWAAPSDLAAYVSGRADDRRLLALARGLAPVRFSPGTRLAAPRDGERPPGLFAALQAVFHRLPAADDQPLPRTRECLARARRGDARGASRAALRRLVSAGLHPVASELLESPEITRRCAAAVLVPVSTEDRFRLLESLLESPVGTLRP